MQVVEPIERMVRLLSMLMKDPLGYQSSQEFRKLKKEDDECAQQSMWPKEALKGMETNFLMNTILRIGVSCILLLWCMRFVLFVHSN